MNGSTSGSAAAEALQGVVDEAAKRAEKRFEIWLGQHASIVIRGFGEVHYRIEEPEGRMDRTDSRLEAVEPAVGVTA